MNIILPLAGVAVFDRKDYFYPPPLTEVGGKPLIQYVTENLQTIDGNNKFIYILKEEDCIKYNFDSTLKLLTPNCEIVILKSKAKGAVCSILMSVDYVDKEKETIVVNADQVFNCDLNKIINKYRLVNAEGGVVTFNSVHPRWSYILADREDNVLQAVEKKPISNCAIAGFYYFKSFNTFMKSAFNAIEIEDYYNDKLYTSALINQLILLNEIVLNQKISNDSYISFYSPQKIGEFEQTLIKK